MKHKPLTIGDPVYATLIAENGTGFIERCIVVGLHDEYVKLFSLDSGADMVADRERIITVEKMNELRGKIESREK